MPGFFSASLGLDLLLGIQAQANSKESEPRLLFAIWKEEEGKKPIPKGDFL